MPAGHETSDPDFAGVSNGTSGWKNKAASLQNGVTHQPVAKKVKLCHSTSNVRRSNRRQKVRGEKQITVSSDMLLRDLKVKARCMDVCRQRYVLCCILPRLSSCGFQIMELFKVAPFDQNLRLGQTILQDSAKTLAELKVHPYSTIYLKADELQARNGQTGEHEDSWGPGDPEEGFKGEADCISFRSFDNQRERRKVSYWTSFCLHFARYWPRRWIVASGFRKAFSIGIAWRRHEKHFCFLSNRFGPQKICPFLGSGRRQDRSSETGITYTQWDLI